MATSNTKTLVYDDFSGGEFGDVAPEKAPDATFTGTNVVVYTDGTIGPRPGLKRVSLTNMPTGVLRGFGFVPTSLDSEASHWFIVNGDPQVYLFRPLSGGYSVVHTFQDLDATVTSGFVWWKESTRQLFGKTYITIPGDQTYQLDMNDATCLTVPDAPGGNDIETYKERLVVAGDSPSVRVSFSEAADFADWPAANYFDIGASWPVDSCMEYRDGLVIFTAWGIWLVTGSLGSSATLRRISEALPARKRSIVRTNEDLLYIPSTRNAPVLYNGTYADEKALRHLENWKDSEDDDVCGAMIYGNRDLLFCAEDRLLWRKNDVWTKHEFDAGASYPVGPAMTRFFDNVAILAYEGDVGVAPRFYYLNMAVERPTFTGDSSASLGDDSSTPVDAEFTLPDYYSPTGEHIRVRRVIVDFTKYRTRETGTNNMTLTCTGLARFRNPGSGNSVATAEWNEASTSTAAGTSGVRERWTANIGQSGWHGAFRLNFSDLRGVKISRILVDIETMTEDPRS